MKISIQRKIRVWITTHKSRWIGKINVSIRCRKEKNFLNKSNKWILVKKEVKIKHKSNSITKVNFLNVKRDFILESLETSDEGVYED